MPLISVRDGDGKAVISEYLAEHPEVAALVLGAAAEGGPGAAGDALLGARGRSCPARCSSSPAG